MPTTTAEPTTTVLTDGPADPPAAPTAQPIATVPTQRTPPSLGTPTVLADAPPATRPAPASDETPTALPDRPATPADRRTAPLSTETLTDRLTRRALGALRHQVGRVLVTGRTDVPAVVAERLTRRDPRLAARATCEDIFAVAHRVLAERHIEVCTDQCLVDAAWSAAWERVGQHSTLCHLGQTDRWRDEVAGAIKGRGLVRFSQYQGSLPHHRHLAATAVWDLYVAYSEELTVRFTHDRADLVAIALDELTLDPACSRYSVVVLDPTLSLTPTMVRLLRALTLTR